MEQDGTAKKLRLHRPYAHAASVYEEHVGVRCNLAAFEHLYSIYQENSGFVLLKSWQCFCLFVQFLNICKTSSNHCWPNRLPCTAWTLTRNAATRCAAHPQLRVSSSLNACTIVDHVTVPMEEMEISTTNKKKSKQKIK